jgi:LacI family transcriptional regulator
MLFHRDLAASYMAAWALAADIRVPEELALLGRGDLSVFCEMVFPSLSSIDVNISDRIRIACDLLERLMRGDNAAPEQILVPALGVVERESTNTLGVTNPHVAAAFRYMWENMDKDISVDDVAQFVGIQRRKLERDFRASLDRGVNAELLRKRLDTLRRLLVSTNDTVAQLAAEVGFRHSSHLHRAFKKAYGISPRQYRMAHRKEQRIIGDETG